MTTLHPKTIENLAHATLKLEGENQTKLFVKSNGFVHDWIMVSKKTGLHIVKQIGAEPEITERVKAHWSGFQENQTR